MKRQDLLAANQRLHFSNRGFPSFLQANVIASSKEMCRIQANPQSLRFLHSIKYASKMFNLMAQTTSLPCCVFKRNADGRAPRRREHFVHSRHNLPNSYLPSV